MELCNPLTNVNDLRLMMRSQYALPKIYATKMNRKQVCNAVQKCSDKDLPLPPLRYQKVNPTTGVYYPRDTPLSGRDFYIMFSKPKLKELQRIARKLGVFQVDATKDMIFMTITEFLKASGVPEPVQVRLYPNKSNVRSPTNNNNNLKPTNNNNNLKPTNNNNNLKPRNNNNNLKPRNNNNNLKPRNNNNLKPPPPRRVGPPIGGPTSRPTANVITPPPLMRRIPLPPTATPRLRDYEELMRKAQYGNESSLKSWGKTRGFNVNRYGSKNELFNAMRRQQRDKLNVGDLRILAKSLGMKNTSSYKTKNGLERAISEFKKKAPIMNLKPTRGPPLPVRSPPPPQIVEVTKAIKTKNVSKLRKLENSTNSNVAKTAREARIAVESNNNAKLRRVAEETNKAALRNLKMYANRKGVKNVAKYDTVETLESAIRNTEGPNATLNAKIKETRAAANAARAAKNNKRVAELKEREMKLVAQLEKNKTTAVEKLEREKTELNAKLAQKKIEANAAKASKNTKLVAKLEAEKMKLAANLERKKAEANAAKASKNANLERKKASNKTKANAVAANLERKKATNNTKLAAKLDEEKMKLAANLERKKAEVNAAKASNNTKLAAKLEQEKMKLAANLERKKAEANAARSKPGLNFSLPKFQRAPPEVRAARREKLKGFFTREPKKSEPKKNNGKKSLIYRMFASNVQKIFDEVYPGAEAGNKKEANKFVAIIKSRGNNVSSVNSIYSEVYGSEAQLRAEGRNNSEISSIMAKRALFKRKLLGATEKIAKEVGVPKSEVAQVIASEPSAPKNDAVSRIFKRVYPENSDRGNATMAKEFLNQIREAKPNTPNKVEAVFKNVYGNRSEITNKNTINKRDRFARELLGIKKEVNAISPELTKQYKRSFGRDPSDPDLIKAIRESDRMPETLEKIFNKIEGTPENNANKEFKLRTKFIDEIKQPLSEFKFDKVNKFEGNNKTRAILQKYIAKTYVPSIQPENIKIEELKEGSLIVEYYVIGIPYVPNRKRSLNGNRQTISLNQINNEAVKKLIAINANAKTLANRYKNVTIVQQKFKELMNKRSVENKEKALEELNKVVTDTKLGVKTKAGRALQGFKAGPLIKQFSNKVEIAAGLNMNVTKYRNAIASRNLSKIKEQNTEFDRAIQAYLQEVANGNVNHPSKTKNKKPRTLSNLKPNLLREYNAIPVIKNYLNSFGNKQEALIKANKLIKELKINIPGINKARKAINTATSSNQVKKEFDNFTKLYKTFIMTKMGLNGNFSINKVIEKSKTVEPTKDLKLFLENVKAFGNGKADSTKLIDAQKAIDDRLELYKKYKIMPNDTPLEKLKKLAKVEANVNNPEVIKQVAFQKTTKSKNKTFQSEIGILTNQVSIGNANSVKNTKDMYLYKMRQVDKNIRTLEDAFKKVSNPEIKKLLTFGFNKKELESVANTNIEKMTNIKNPNLRTARVRELLSESIPNSNKARLRYYLELKGYSTNSKKTIYDELARLTGTKASWYEFGKVYRRNNGTKLDLKNVLTIARAKVEKNQDTKDGAIKKILKKLNQGATNISTVGSTGAFKFINKTKNTSAVAELRKVLVKYRQAATFKTTNKEALVEEIAPGVLKLPSLTPIDKEKITTLLNILKSDGNEVNTRKRENIRTGVKNVKRKEFTNTYGNIYAKTKNSTNFSNFRQIYKDIADGKKNVTNADRKIANEALKKSISINSYLRNYESLNKNVKQTSYPVRFLEFTFEYDKARKGILPKKNTAEKAKKIYGLTQKFDKILKDGNPFNYTTQKNAYTLTDGYLADGEFKNKEFKKLEPILDEYNKKAKNKAATTIQAAKNKAATTIQAAFKGRRNRIKVKDMKAIKAAANRVKANSERKAAFKAKQNALLAAKAEAEKKKLTTKRAENLARRINAAMKPGQREWVGRLSNLGEEPSVKNALKRHRNKYNQLNREQKAAAEKARKEKEAKVAEEAKAKEAERLAKAKEAERLAKAKEAERLAKEKEAAEEAKRKAKAEEARKVKEKVNRNAASRQIESIEKVTSLKNRNKQGNRNYPRLNEIPLNLASRQNVQDALKKHQKSYNAIVEERRKRLAKSFNIKPVFEPNRKEIGQLINTVKTEKNESKVKTIIEEAQNKRANVIKALEAAGYTKNSDVYTKVEKALGSGKQNNLKDARNSVKETTKAYKRTERQKLFELLGGSPIPPIANPTKGPINRTANRLALEGGSGVRGVLEVAKSRRPTSSRGPPVNFAEPIERKVAWAEKP